MNVILIFLAAVGTVIIWWLAGQRLLSKPCLETGILLPPARPQAPAPPASRIGLFIFLGVVGALFSLSISAYFMRMAASDWWAIPVPRLLWANTAMLLLCSATLQWARREAGRDRMETMRLALAAAFALASLHFTAQSAQSARPSAPGRALPWRRRPRSRSRACRGA